jgi:hypothetical protein
VEVRSADAFGQGLWGCGALSQIAGRAGRMEKRVKRMRRRGEEKMEKGGCLELRRSVEVQYASACERGCGLQGLDRRGSERGRGPTVLLSTV